ncbi:MAG: lytic transglycosylase domain-containing protein [Myxococcales bacterium]|nr:lytic transglycosylase domain-containing protein [Myxococcales bacterium]
MWRGPQRKLLEVTAVGVLGSLGLAALCIGGSGFGASMPNVLWLAGCSARNSGVGGPDPSAVPLSGQAPHAGTVAGNGAASATAGGFLPEGAESTRWRQALRQSDWTTAYAELSSMSDAERAPPAIRFAFGVAARLAHHPEIAVRTLTDLERELPLLTNEIREHWARAAAISGPHEAAAQVLLASEHAEDQLAAVKALTHAGKLPEALRACDSAVRVAQKARHRDAELEARLYRAKLAEQSGDRKTASADLLWALRTHPARGDAPLAELERLGADIAVADRIRVLEASATRADVELTLTTLDGIGVANPAHKDAVLHARANTLRRVRDHVRAAVELDRAATRLPAQAAMEARYYAGRALATSGRHAEALVRFHALARGSGVFAERAQLRRAELFLQLGRDAEAAAAYGKLASKLKKGEQAKAARYGRAVALLGGGQAKLARRELALLRENARDPNFVASLTELEGVAASRAGDSHGAATLWRKVMATHPLSWPALCAHARLSQLGATSAPPHLPPPVVNAAAPLVVEMPEAAALLTSLGLDAAAEASLRAVEDQVKRRHPGRESEALCELYGQLARARRRHQIGVGAMNAELLARAPNDAGRWASSCAYPSPWQELVLRAEHQRGLPRGLVHSVMRQESAFEPLALSPAGARGLMQLMPNTAKEAAKELSLLDSVPDDDYFVRPGVNIDIGAYYLGKLLNTFDGSLPLAVASYNAGPHAVSSWLAGGDRDADVWVARIPYRETRHYVAHVLSNLARYQYLAGGNEAVSQVQLRLPARATLANTDY